MLDRGGVRLKSSHYNLKGVRANPKPVQKPHPPLWMACTQEDTFQLAGDLGLGCLVNTLGGS